MNFSNPELSITDLPRAEEAKLQNIDPRYYSVMLYNHISLWLMLFVTFLVIIILNEEFHSWITASLSLSCFAALCILSFRLRYLSFKNKAFSVREHDILYQSGWLVKSLHACPFNRIQHCSVDAGMFERNLGLCKLKIYSAGSSDNSDIAIPGLLPEDADSIRELIIKKNQD